MSIASAARVLAVAVLLCWAGGASAQLRLCNSTSKPVSVAVLAPAGLPSARVWNSEGWWNLAPGSCKNAVGGPLTNRYYYYFARRSDGLAWSATDASNGAVLSCINDEQFTIQQIESSCESRGFQSVYFRKEDLGAGSVSTHTLTFSVDGESAPRGERVIESEARGGERIRDGRPPPRVLSRPLPYPPGPELDAYNARQEEEKERKRKAKADADAAARNQGSSNSAGRGAQSEGDARSFIRWGPSSPAGGECSIGSSKTTIQNVHSGKAIYVDIQQIDRVGIESAREPWVFTRRLSANETIYSCTYMPCINVTTGCPTTRSWFLVGARF